MTAWRCDLAWRYRKSKRLPGGFRLNLSKSGLGFSWGVRGFRVGRDSRGRIVRTLSIPGTGLYNRQYLSGSNAPEQSSRLSCGGFIGATFGILFTVGVVGNLIAKGNTGDLIVLLVLAIGGYFAWRFVRRPENVAAPLADAPLSATKSSYRAGERAKPIDSTICLTPNVQSRRSTSR